MTTATAIRRNALALPPALRNAQEAIHLTEVQEMLRKLSDHGLGIYMPHMHDELTGEFQPLPDRLTQVESGLEVSFRPSDDVARQEDRFMCVFRIIVTGRFGSVTAEFGNVTGHFGNVTDGVLQAA